MNLELPAATQTEVARSFTELSAREQAKYYKDLMDLYPGIDFVDQRDWREAPANTPPYFQKGFSQVVFQVSETSKANQKSVQRDNQLHFLKKFIPKTLKDNKIPSSDTAEHLYHAFHLAEPSLKEWVEHIQSLIKAGNEQGQWEGLEAACFALYEQMVEEGRTEFKVHLNPTAASFPETVRRLAEFISETTPEERAFIRGFKINCIPSLQNLDTYTPQPEHTILPNIAIYFHEEATDLATLKRVAIFVARLDKKMKERASTEEVRALPANRTPRFTFPVTDLIGIVQIDSGVKMAGQQFVDPASQKSALEALFDPESNNAFLRTLDWRSSLIEQHP